MAIFAQFLGQRSLDSSRGDPFPSSGIWAVGERFLGILREDIIPPLVNLERGVEQLGRESFRLLGEWFGEPIYRAYTSGFASRVSGNLEGLIEKVKAISQGFFGGGI